MFVFFLKRLAQIAALYARRLVWFFNPILSLFGVKLRGKGFDEKQPMNFPGLLTMVMIWLRLISRPDLLLQVREVRQILAKQRAKKLITVKNVKKFNGSDDKVAANTLQYNLNGASSAADLDRPSIMFDVVSGIERVWKNCANLDVLSIGPRSEIEIFGLIGAGFDVNRIRAVDLFSYSPYVDIGDMHNLPYPDNSFDMVFLGWVLSYSVDQKQVARELLRVCRDSGIIVIAGDYSDASKDDGLFNNTTTHMQSTGQLLGLFEGNVGQVYFTHEPSPPDVAMVMTVFEVRKSE